MNIESVVVGNLETNCYIIGDSKEVLIIDPGGSETEIIKIIGNRNVSMILLTHGHIDHILAVPKIKQQFHTKIGIHKNGPEILRNPNLNLSSFLGSNFIIDNVDFTFEDGDKIDFLDEKIKVIYTPGHTYDSCCFFFKENLFCGDTLFHMSIGRTDFPTADENLIIKSIIEKILILPEKTQVYPGHMSNTTIEFEKKNNPFILM